MAAPSGATVLSVGSVTIVANGGQTGDLLASIMKAAAGFNVQTVGAGASSLPSPTVASPAELVIEPGYTGTMIIPSGYELVVNGATSDSNPISGGDASTSIVSNGALNYSGGAGVVLGVGGSGTVDDTATGATLAFSGNYNVTVSGNNDTIGVDNSGSTNESLDGSDETVVTGGGSPSVSSGASAAATGVTSTQTIDVNAGSTGDVVSVLSGASDLVFAVAAFTADQSGGSSTVVTGGAGMVTLNASGGSALVYDHAGSAGNVINAGPSTEYVAATTADTAASIYNASAGGADTIFSAGAKIDYSNSAGTANSLFFLGGAGAVTVSAAAAETVFGGTGGGSYSVGATSFSFLGDGGADTLTGAAGAASVLAFGWQNENLSIDQASGTKGNTLIPVGNGTVNASLAAGGNTWQVVNQAVPALPGGTFVGDASLVGSTAGSDLFVVYIDPTASSLPPAHTIDIANWQTSDTLFLSNLGASNQSLSATDLAAVNAFDAGSSHSLTLSDGTTIDFTGAKPTTIAHV
jgi:hypothetical protein